MPGSVQSLVQARLDQLDPADKQALLAAAVFGQRFSLEGLRYLLERPDYGCAALVEQVLVRPQGDDFLFAHALIRDAVYDLLLKASRRALHRRAADWFEGRDPVLYAEHLDRAADPTAAGAYLEAARHEAAVYHYEPAQALVGRGLAIAAAAAERSALTCLQGELWHHLGSMAASRAAYEAALAAAGDDEPAACRARLGLAAVKRVTEDLDGALADLERAQDVAERHGLTEELARIHFLRGNLYFPRGNIAGCLEEHQKSLELARTLRLARAGSAGARRARRCRVCPRPAAHLGAPLPGLHRGLPPARLRPDRGRQPADGRDLPDLRRRPRRRRSPWGLEAVAAATRVGHQRAMIIGCHAVHFYADRQGRARARPRVRRARHRARATPWRPPLRGASRCSFWPRPAGRPASARRA